MAYPNNTSQIIRFLRPAVADDQYEVSQRSTGISVLWNSQLPEPTEQEIIDAGNDLATNPTGQVFSQWLAEHGGDPTQTSRRAAGDALDANQTTDVRVLRALVIELAAFFDRYVNLVEYLDGRQGVNIPANARIPRLTAQDIRDRIKANLNQEN